MDQAGLGFGTIISIHGEGDIDRDRQWLKPQAHEVRNQLKQVGVLLTCFSWFGFWQTWISIHVGDQSATTDA